MVPSSALSNAQQHDQRFPSIIRTRSQQGRRPLAPVDLYASPFKKAVHDHHHSTNQTASELTTKNIMIQDITDKTRHETPSSPSHKKRALSFSRNDNAGKRTRVLVQSNKVNSLSHEHSEGSLGTPHRDNPTTPVKLSLAPRAMSGSPGKGLTHMDFTRVPSPWRPNGSPNKTFNITRDDGFTMRVPITPIKRPTAQENKILTVGPQSDARPSETEDEVCIPPPLTTLTQPSTPVFNPPTSTLSNHRTFLSSAVEEDARHIHADDTAQTQLQSTSVRSPDLLGGGSPLSPPPRTPGSDSPTLSRKTSIPFNLSGQGFTPTARPLISSASSGLLQNSPSKSRIPIPSSPALSRLPKPSSLSISPLPVAASSSPKQAPPRPSLVKTKTRTKDKIKLSGVRSKAPLTRLAAKRGLRRTSSFTGLRTGASVGSNAPPPPPNSAEASNVAAAAYVRTGTERRSLVTSSLLSSENAPVLAGAPAGPPASSGSGSPKKPTPLTALSTALQKLMATPPAAPLPRPRPNTSLGFVHPSLTPSQVPTLLPSNSQDDIHVDTQTPECSQNSVVLQRSKTLGHNQINKTNPGVGKMGLPLRRPSTADSNGRSAPWAGAPFASKQTTLSTVPASPARSAAPTEVETTQDAPPDVLDVDAWAPSDCKDKGKEKVENETNKLAYSVPLTDEPRTKDQHLLELVSPSRRASQASMLLTQSLSLPRGPAGRQAARSASASTAVRPILRSPVKTRGRTRPPPPAPPAALDGDATAKPDDPMAGKRSNARMPGSLDVLKDCIIFVDIRTEEGEDAAALFVDMLRALGARILAKPGKSCTHLVYKAGLPSTITRYKLLPEPRPLPVSIGWVVECVEKRAHVDETRFLVNLNEIGVAGGVQRRRSMQPRQMRTLTLGQLDDGEPTDVSVRTDSSFTSEEPSASGFSFTNLSPLARSANDNLPPLERARQRSFRLPRE